MHIPHSQDPELPEGWEARKNVDGRMYYVDHETRITTWEHPLEAAKKTEEREKLGPMPVSGGTGDAMAASVIVSVSVPPHADWLGGEADERWEDLLRGSW